MWIADLNLLAATGCFAMMIVDLSWRYYGWTLGFLLMGLLNLSVGLASLGY